MDPVEKLDHDLSNSIRNFKVALSLMNGETRERETAIELLSASIEQLEDVLVFARKLEVQKSDSTQTSNIAQKAKG